MRAVVQRVARAAVSVAGEPLARIGPGLLVLLGVHRNDGAADVEWMAEKVAGLRVFADERGKFDRSVGDVGGAVLVVSQFTLHGDVRKGRRPSFTDAAPPDHARALYGEFIAALRRRELPVEGGRFGAHMEVELVNDGPVTILLCSPAERRGGACAPE